MSEGAGSPVALVRPDAATAAAAIDRALDGNRLVSVVGRAAASGAHQLSPGNWAVLLKPDGHVIVHGRAGSAPAIRLREAGGLACVDANGTLLVGPADGDDWELKVDQVRAVTTVGSRATSTAGGSASGPARHDRLVEKLLTEPDLVGPGFEPLATERATSAGPVDLYGRDAEGRTVAVEVKGDRAGPNAVGQLARYVDALEDDLHGAAEVRGVLVAPSATARARNLLERQGFAFRRVPATR